MMPRSNIRPCRTGIPATRTARAASTTSSPSAAIAAATIRRSRGRRSKPARRSPGNTRPASCAATIRAASSTRSRCRTATSRSIRGTKMIHLGKNTSSRIISKGISAGVRRTPIAAWSRPIARRRMRATSPQCDSLLIGDKCGAHTVPYIEAKNSIGAVRA